MLCNPLSTAIRQCTYIQPPGMRPRARCRALGTSTSKSEEQKLSSLVNWLVKNGAKGFDPADANTKVAVFLQGPSNRGIIASTDVKAGQVLFQVPVKLGIIDDAENDEYPWSVRLAAKLLRLKAEGDRCLWGDYVAVLPERVFNATSQEFSFEDDEAICNAEAREEAHFSRWIASSNFKRLAEEGGMIPEGTTEEAFCDAMTVVHSRTFSIPANDRPSGLARLLMPGIDLLNHAGDVDLNMNDGSVAEIELIATDACRWDLVPKIGGEYQMVVSAVRDIVKGEEVTLSYGERSNDDFFIHYGFVPPRNVHDTVRLHEDLVSAMEWTIERIHEMGTAAPDEGLVKLYETLRTEHENDGKVDTGHMEFADSERTSKLKNRISLQSNGRVDERYALVLEKIHAYVSQYDAVGTREDFIRDHVSARAFEVLEGMRCNLLTDLDRLCSEMPDDELHDFATMRQTYKNRIISSPWWDKLQKHKLQKESSLTANADTDHLMTVMFRAYKSCILWDCLLAR